MLTIDLLNALRPSLFAGHFNLLLGSGVSLDSTDGRGNPLKSATDLTIELCELNRLLKYSTRMRGTLLG